MAIRPDSLRSLIQDCLAKHLYSTAAFYADLLVSTTAYDPSDVYLLAQVYYVSRQYRRAVLLLQKHGSMDELPFRYLAAKCLAECAEWEECLALLGDGSMDELDVYVDRSAHLGQAIQLRAALCLLRARAHEALDNRPSAIHWFRAAIAADPYCQEAVAALLQHHMLTNGEELSLVDSLRLAPGDEWLQLLYRCQCKQYEQAHCMEAQLEQLEQLASPGVAAQSSSGMHAKQQQQQQHRAGKGANPKPAAAVGEDPATAATPGTSRRPSRRNARSSKEQAPLQQQQQQQRETPSSIDASPTDMTLDTPSPAGASDDVDGCQPSTSGRDVHKGSSSSSSSGGKGCGAAAVQMCRAGWHLHCGRYEAAFTITQQLLERDPYDLQCSLAHSTAALQLGRKNELFLRGHQLVREYPQAALSWYAVGCYYMATRQYDQARHYLGRASLLDKKCPEVWLAYGHAFAALDESDQAMAAYRTAARHCPGLAAPLLGMGMEYARMHNTQLAEHMFGAALALCPRDPLVRHELGVLAFRAKQYGPAAQHFQEALRLSPEGQPGPQQEPTLVNLAHTMRKLRQYSAAVRLYQQALGLCPLRASTHSALGFTYQLQGNAGAAVEQYHKALGLVPDDSFAAEMLGLALQDWALYESHASLG